VIYPASVLEVIPVEANVSGHFQRFETLFGPSFSGADFLKRGFCESGDREEVDCKIDIVP
jgi:hypothetical protein